MKIAIQDGEQLDNGNGSPKENREAEIIEIAENPVAEDVDMLEREKISLEKRELPERTVNEITELNEQIQNLTEELQQREKELVAAEDKALRAIADAENYKKRMAREKDDAVRFAAAPVAESLIPALDNLQKAVMSAKTSQGGADQLRDGVEIIYNQFMDILAGHGLEKLDVTGKPYDPETSEGLMLTDTTEHEDGIVMMELIPGYKFKDRVIRTAKVQIARNPQSSMGEAAKEGE